MVRLVIWLSATLLAQTPPPPPASTPPGPDRPATPAAEAPPASVPIPIPDPSGPATDPQPDPAEAKALAEYNGLRDKTPNTAAAQWKLALWCEAKGLRPEAYSHFGRVIELDPGRDAAWLKLGFKKHGNQWLTDAQVAAQDQQRKSDKDWTTRLKAWHRALHGPKPRNKADEANAGLDAITDPAAAGSIYREFAAGSPKDQEIAARLLGQVNSPIASKGLAMLAVYGKSPDVRRVATETLRSKPESEYLDLLVAMMKDPIRYQVVPVGGPGSPGVLKIEGERNDIQRIYAPPPPPGFNVRPGDIVTYDEGGMPVISRTELKYFGPAGSGSRGLFLKKDGKGIAVQETVPPGMENDVETTTTYSVRQGQAIAQQGAAFAQAQLASDIERLDAVNAVRKRANEVVTGVAKAATGKNPGPLAKDWQAILPRQNPRYRRPTSKAVIDEMVPLDYIPDFAAAMDIRRQLITIKAIDT